jgi:hypothetical protein
MAINLQQPELTASNNSRYWSCIASFVFSFLSCFPTFAQESIFSDATSSFGIDYSYGLGIDYQYGLISFNGGFSFADFNNDGLDDLTFGSVAGDTLYLYVNDGNGFSALPTSTMFAETGLSSCLYWVDYDNDGDKDLYIANIGSYNKLYRNDGDLNFTDVTIESGILSGITYTYSACWTDYDKDGWLDLYFVNRDMTGVAWGAPPNSPNFLFRNKGDGTFEDVTVQAGVRNTPGLGYAVVAVDYNSDGWPDLYVGNDKDTCNKLYKNNGDGTFEDVSEPNTTGRCISSMGIDLADFDGNGHLDLYVTNGPGGNLLLQNNGGTNNWFKLHLQGVISNLDAIGTSIEVWSGGQKFIKYTTCGNSFASQFSNDYIIGLGQHELVDSLILKWPSGVINNYYDLAVNQKVTFVEDPENSTGACFSVFYPDADSDGYGDMMVAGSVACQAPEGFVSNNLDCNDGDMLIHPNAIESCDGLDNNCNNLIDEDIPIYTYYLDADNDGFGDPLTAIDTCLTTPLPGYVSNDLDCATTDDSIYPDAPELCDGLDNNCNDLIDEDIPLYTYYLDADEDGFGDPLVALDTCLATVPLGYVENNEDCDDDIAEINPDANEIPNNDADEDCDGEILIVGIEEFGSGYYINMVPNPVVDDLYVKHRLPFSATLHIINNLNKIVAAHQLPVADNTEMINLASLPSGVYYVVISNLEHDFRYSKAIIKIR